MKQHLFEHSSEEGHHGFLEDVSITSIDKTDSSNPLQRENYWRSVLKTRAPWGLNVKASVWNSVLFILTTGFVWIVIRVWFMETILVLIIIVPTLFTIIDVATFMILLFFCCCLCNCVGVLLVIIIEFGFIIAAIVVIFVALLLLFHHCFVLFNTCYLSSYFQYYHCCFCVVVVSILLLLLLFNCPCWCHFCCISFFVITITIAA